ncbi:hypothetical protein [Marinomonas gallaica]|uniref:hypothetical protein n=1 Tax=Marinomonas gallaica TaxID=1806667 RepID=UPI003A9134FB
MKSIFILAVSLSAPCLASFSSFHTTSRENGQFLKTHFTVSDRAQFHIGCGIGEDYKGFKIIGLRHPRLYPWYGVSNIELSIDGSQKVKIEGGSKQYDDMYYAKNPPKEILEQVFNGNLVEVLLFNREERVTFSLDGSHKVYTKLWKECGL